MSEPTEILITCETGFHQSGSAPVRRLKWRRVGQRKWRSVVVTEPFPQPFDPFAIIEAYEADDRGET